MEEDKWWMGVRCKKDGGSGWGKRVFVVVVVSETGGRVILLSWGGPSSGIRIRKSVWKAAFGKP